MMGISVSYRTGVHIEELRWAGSREGMRRSFNALITIGDLG